MAKVKATRKLPSIKNLMYFYTRFIMFALSILSILAIILAILYVLNIGALFAIILTIIWFAGFFSIGILLIIMINRITLISYKGLYETSRSIVKDFSNNKKKFDRYPNNMVQEFKDMNKNLSYLEHHLNNSVVFAKNLDYESLGLTYSMEELNIVDNKSFVRHIPEIIMMSQAYRNAFILITYEDTVDELFGQNKRDIIAKIYKSFDYSDIIIADEENKYGYYVYIPRIDSLSRLKEEIDLFLTGTSLVRNAPNGNIIVHPKVSVVIYPYSDIDHIIRDLQYASRRGDNINIYLPERINTLKDESILHNSLSINNVNLLVSNLTAIRAYNTGTEDFKKAITKQIDELASYIGADFAGIIIRDDDLVRNVSFITINNTDAQWIKDGDYIPPIWLEVVGKIADPDGTYFFSSRSHMNNDLGKLLDPYNISSGHIFVLSDDLGPVCAVYFYKLNEEMNLDSYLRESLFTVSYRASSILRDNFRNNRLREAEERSNVIMKLAHYAQYAVDRESFEVKYASTTLTDLFGNPVGRKCYRFLYHLNKPCEGCPLLTKKKYISKYKDRQFEVSLPLTGVRQNIARLLMRPIEGEGYSYDRFDSGFLINSYYALFEDLKNIYLYQGRGYVLLLHIENNIDLVEKYGNEGYLRYIKEFTRALEANGLNTYKFYAYSNNTIALIGPDFLRNEVIENCEKIYDVSKSEFIKLDEDALTPLTLNYIAVKYPQEYATNSDLLRHCERVINSYDHSKHLDQIYFEGHEYFRSASHNQFINEVIEESFTKGTFKVKLQPMINTGSKKISGAELLIRLSDEYRNQAISADEIIKIAGQEKKIALISNALINYVGEVYQKYAQDLFRPKGFRMLSINTDYSFFSNKNFINETFKFIVKYKFPRHFLSFEMNEDDLANHYDFYRTVFPRLKSYGIFICIDRYRGNRLSINRAKALGVDGVKIARELIRDIDTNRGHFNFVKETVRNAENLHIKVLLIGVENKDQYFMLRDLSKDIEMQGFYFYSPIDPTQMIDALKMQ